MDARSFLQDMLSEGRSLWETGSGYADRAAAAAAERLGAEKGSENHELYKTVTKGAVGVGALALALGTRSGGAVARLGGLAALGAMAYGAYQKSQGGGESDEATLDAVDGPEGERRARAVLKALIAGARADGQIDADERALIEEKLAALGPEAESFFMEELMKPLDAATLAAEAQSQQEAREIYAAVALACGQAGPAERAFLDALAAAMSLPSSVVSEIDAHVASI